MSAVTAVWVVVGVLLLIIAIRFGVLVARLIRAGSDRDEGRLHQRQPMRHAEGGGGFLSD